MLGKKNGSIILFFIIVSQSVDCFQLRNLRSIFPKNAIKTRKIHIESTSLKNVQYIKSSNNNNLNAVIDRRQAIIPFATTFIVPNLWLAFPRYSIASTTASNDNFLEGPRGIKYIVSKEGDQSGPKPQRGQKIKTSYTLTLNGFLEDGGQKIDSSKSFVGDKPFEFVAGIGQVIKGWDLSLLDMTVGETRKIIIPSELGYGEKGAGGKIPGGATLYFEVELKGLGKPPGFFTPEQEKWLAEHPL